MPWRLNQASGFRQQGKYNRTSAAERSEIRREAVHPPPVQDAPPCPDLAHPEFYSKSSVFFPPLSNHPMKNAQVIPGEPKIATLYPTSSSLARECHWLVTSAPPQGNIDHRSQVLRIAAAVLSVEFKNARSQRVGSVRIRDHKTQMFEELSATEFATLSVEDMAHKFGYSRRHLNRMFHKYFGRSITSLRMEMRLLKAWSLLRDPELRIYNVAKQCGFSHLGLFHTCFKQRFGKSPGECRTAAAQLEGTHKLFNRTDYEFFQSL